MGHWLNFWVIHVNGGEKNVDPGVALPIGSAASGIIFELLVQVAVRKADCRILCTDNFRTFGIQLTSNENKPCCPPGLEII
jgi:hypothetical protein